jgi:hypothetical protein
MNNPTERLELRSRNPLELALPHEYVSEVRSELVATAQNEFLNRATTAAGLAQLETGLVALGVEITLAEANRNRPPECPEFSGTPMVEPETLTWTADGWKVEAPRNFNKAMVYSAPETEASAVPTG